MKKHGHDGARHRKDIDIVEKIVRNPKKSVNGGQTKGAAQKTRRKRQLEGSPQGQSDRVQRYKSRERNCSLRISKSDKKIPKGQSTHLCKKTKDKTYRTRLRTEGAREKLEKRQRRQSNRRKVPTTS